MNAENEQWKINLETKKNFVGLEFCGTFFYLELQRVKVVVALVEGSAASKHDWAYLIQIGPS